MAELNEQMKALIVTAHARFVPIPEIQVMVEDQFDVKPDNKQVRCYHPQLSCYEAGQKWIELFDIERKRYLEDVSAIPIANQGFRLNALNETYQRALKAKNMTLANATLEQASKEVGGAFTNVRDVRVEKTEKGFAGLTSEERREAVADMLRAAIEAK